MREDYIEAIYL